jgi:hypothetical protein
MAFELSTLHIFGYGETQVIGQDGETPVNKKAASSQLAGLQAVVDNVFSKKPADNPTTNVYHAVNIFNNMFADYQPHVDLGGSAINTQQGFRVPFAELDKALIDSLVAEVLAAN